MLLKQILILLFEIVNIKLLFLLDNVSCERSMDATSLSNEHNEPHTFESTKQTADMYVTRYRRTVKKPDCLNYTV